MAAARRITCCCTGSAPPARSGTDVCAALDAARARTLDRRAICPDTATRTRCADYSIGALAAAIAAVARARPSVPRDRRIRSASISGSRWRAAGSASASSRARDSGRRSRGSTPSSTACCELAANPPASSRRRTKPGRATARSRASMRRLRPTRRRSRAACAHDGGAIGSPPIRARRSSPAHRSPRSFASARCPVLLARGERDTMVTLAELRALLPAGARSREHRSQRARRSAGRARRARPALAQRHALTRRDHADRSNAQRRSRATSTRRTCRPEFYANPYPCTTRCARRDPVHRCPDGSLVPDALRRPRARLPRSASTSAPTSSVAFGPKYGLDSPLYEHHTTSLVFNDRAVSHARAAPDRRRA